MLVVWLAQVPQQPSRMHKCRLRFSLSCFFAYMGQGCCMRYGLIIGNEVLPHYCSMRDALIIASLRISIHVDHNPHYQVIRKGPQAVHYNNNIKN